MANSDSVRYIIIFQIALFTLSAVVVGTLIGSFILAFYQIAIPDSIVAMGAASVGALVGLFTPNPKSMSA